MWGADKKKRAIEAWRQLPTALRNHAASWLDLMSLAHLQAVSRSWKRGSLPIPF